MALILLLILIFTVIFIYHVAENLHLSVRLPWLIYTVSYSITTLIGGIIIGMPEGLSFLGLIYPTLSLNFINIEFNFEYWFYLYLPLLLIGSALFLFRKKSFFFEKKLSIILPQILPKKLNFLTALLITFAYIAYCSVLLYSNNYLGNVFSYLGGELDYKSTYLLRHKMMEQLAGRGCYFYEIVYVGLPFLSWISLFSYFNNKKSLSWGVLFAFQVFFIAYFSLSSIQKAPVLIYMIGFSLSLIVLNKMKFFHFLFYFSMTLIIFLFLQSLYTDELVLILDVAHIIFRVAQSFPFYLSIYPSLEAFQSFNYGLGILGLGTTINDNLVVGAYMESAIDWTDNAAAGSSHLRAYSQGGLFPSLLSLFFVLIFIRICAKLNKLSFGASIHGLIIQAYITLYYMTQTSFRGAIIESYGIFWVFTTLAALYFIQKILKANFRGA